MDWFSYTMDRTPFSADRFILTAVLFIPVLYIFARVLPVTLRNKRNYRKLLKEGIPVQAELGSLRRENQLEIDADPIVQERTFLRPLFTLKFELNGAKHSVEHEYFGAARKLKTPQFKPGSMHQLRVLPSAPEKIFECEGFGGFSGEPIPFLKDRLIFRDPVLMDRLARALTLLFITLLASLLFLDS